MLGGGGGRRGWRQKKNVAGARPGGRGGGMRALNFRRGGGQKRYRSNKGLQVNGRQPTGGPGSHRKTRFPLGPDDFPCAWLAGQPGGPFRGARAPGRGPRRETSGLKATRRWVGWGTVGLREKKGLGGGQRAGLGICGLILRCRWETVWDGRLLASLGGPKSALFSREAQGHSRAAPPGTPRSSPAHALSVGGGQWQSFLRCRVPTRKPLLPPEARRRSARSFSSVPQGQVGVPSA